MEDFKKELFDKYNKENLTCYQLYYRLMLLSEGLGTWVLCCTDSNMMNVKQAENLFKLERAAKIFAIRKLIPHNSKNDLPQLDRKIAVAFCVPLESFRKNIFTMPELLETLPPKFSDLTRKEQSERSAILKLYEGLL